jgi:hypothetical protein
MVPCVLTVAQRLILMKPGRPVFYEAANIPSNLLGLPRPIAGGNNL